MSENPPALPAWFQERFDAPMDERDPMDLAEISFHEVEGGAQRVLHIPAPDFPDRRSVVLLPGWGAPIEGWREYYGPILGRVELYVIETREKPHTKVDKSYKDKSVERMARNVDMTLQSLELGDHAMFGSSWGSAIMLEGLIHGCYKNTPAFGVCDPAPRIWFSKFFLKNLAPLIPVGLLGVVKNPMKSIALRNFKEPVQRARVEQFIEAADPWRWKNFAIGAAEFELVGRLGAIDREVWIINGAHDAIHDSSQYHDLTAEIPRGRFFHHKVDESKRERLNAIITEALARASGDELPDALAAMEQPVTRG